MYRSVVIAATIGLLLIVGRSPVSAQTPATGQSSVPGARFFGSVTLNGAPANGVTVTASIGGIACGFGSANGNGNYFVDVAALPGCTTPGSTVLFTVNGTPANPNGILPLTPGSAVQLNLSAGSPPVPVAAVSPALVSTTVTRPVLTVSPLQAPSSPANLQATPLDSTHVRLDWSRGSGNEDGFGISSPFGFVNYEAGTSYTVVDLAPGGYYCLIVYAFNGAGNSGYSNWACVTTPS